MQRRELRLTVHDRITDVTGPWTAARQRPAHVGR